jgi:DNA repair protein RecN (Recombination protein N)
MLLNLRINNYALINNLDVNFSNNFTVISGDTGSGKSIILDALSILLGKRIDKKKLNNKKCVIEGEFQLSLKNKSFFNDHNLDYDKNTIIRREINPKGKIRTFINDTPVPASILSDFTSLIIEIHAQHENLIIKDSKEQLYIIDKIADNKDVKIKYLSLFNEYKSLKEDLYSFNNKRKLNEDDYKLYKFHFNEIVDADINVNENIDLENEINAYQNINEILEITRGSYNLFSGENQVLNNLNKIKRGLSKFDNFKGLVDRIDSNIIDLSDVADELVLIADNLNNNSQNINKLLSRQDLVNNILRKHNVNDTYELSKVKDRIKLDLDIYENYEGEKTIIIDKINNAFRLLNLQANKLSNSRKKIICDFEKKIDSLLKTLGMPHAKFKVILEDREEANKDGVDNVQFQFSSNPGVPVQEISKIASGGEISRLMLALKYIIANDDGIGTLIFDEIDTGVSGKIASFMGDLMKTISKKTQLISVTHLPQIASKSDEHIKVFKTIKDNTTKTEIKLLNKEERIIEIARLLSGKKISDAAITNAKELLNQ